MAATLLWCSLLASVVGAPPSAAVPPVRRPPGRPGSPLTSPCTWNTSVESSLGVPGCCGWPDGCSCGCCQRNYTAIAAAPPPAPWVPATRPCTTRFLSFYDECGVDLLAGPAEPVTSEPTSGTTKDGFESLPLVFGVCTPVLPFWGCWRDQLQIFSGQHTGVMMHIRGSGALVCGGAGAYHLCMNNCSDLFATDPTLGPAWKNASAPHPAVCGLAWLAAWLEELKPDVMSGVVKGFFIGVRARLTNLSRAPT